jgi:hypothetical protein
MPVILEPPNRDTGTGLVSQRDEPETFVSDADGDPTGLVEMDGEVTYSDFTHEDGPTGVAATKTETTYEADWPKSTTAPQTKAVEADESDVDDTTVAADDADNKSVAPKRASRTRKGH